MSWFRTRDEFDRRVTYARITALGQEAVDGAVQDYLHAAAHAARTVAGLNARGVGRNDRVAIVLPNGPARARLVELSQLNDPARRFETK